MLSVNGSMGLLSRILQVFFYIIQVYKDYIVEEHRLDHAYRVCLPTLMILGYVSVVKLWYK